MGIGETAALATAFLWAVSSLLYGRVRLSVWGIVLGKNALASLVLLVQLLIIGGYRSQPVLSADASAWWWMGLSGIVGILLGDMLYFRSLQILGPRRALIVSTTAPVFAAVLGWMLLDEALGPGALLGMTITLAGVIWVVSERPLVDESPGLYPGSTLAGIVFGVLGAICLAAGGAASKVGMAECDPLEATFIRIFVSVPVATLAAIPQGRLQTAIRQSAKREVLKWFLPAILCGTWLGVWMSQVAYKHAGVAVATTLLSTCPLFVIPLVRVFLGQRVSVRAIAGTIVAIGGVALLVSGSN